jgi:hypothetical protein
MPISNSIYKNSEALKSEIPKSKILVTPKNSVTPKCCEKPDVVPSLKLDTNPSSVMKPTTAINTKYQYSAISNRNKTAEPN